MASGSVVESWTTSVVLCGAMGAWVPTVTCRVRGLVLQVSPWDCRSMVCQLVHKTKGHILLHGLWVFRTGDTACQLVHKAKEDMAHCRACGSVGV